MGELLITFVDARGVAAAANIVASLDFVCFVAGKMPRGIISSPSAASCHVEFMPSQFDRFTLPKDHRNKIYYYRALGSTMILKKQLALHLAAAATALMCRGEVIGISAFTTAIPPLLSCSHVQTHHKQSTSMLLLQSSTSDDAPPVNIVSLDAFIRAIDILKSDLGIEIIPQDQRPMYAIGKLVAQLPLELVSGIRFADCETLTLISQLRETVVDATGLQSLDTIVAIRAGSGSSDGSYGYEGSTNGAGIADTAQAYTNAINYAMQNDLKEIELEVNRLVPLMPSTE